MAGLVFGELGRAPEVGDEVRTDGLRLRVLEIEGSRISGSRSSSAWSEPDELHSKPH